MLDVTWIYDDGTVGRATRPLSESEAVITVGWLLAQGWDVSVGRIDDRPITGEFCARFAADAAARCEAVLADR